MIREYHKLREVYPDYTWRQYLEEWSTGNVRPYAKAARKRIPPSIMERLKTEAANQGVNNSQDSPALRQKRNDAIAEAFAFVVEESDAGNKKANFQNIAARLGMATERQLDLYLAADHETKRALADSHPDEATLPADQRINLTTGEVEYINPVTGRSTQAAYIHDNVYWYH
jgi:hypothetical protein